MKLTKLELFTMSALQGLSCHEGYILDEDQIAVKAVSIAQRTLEELALEQLPDAVEILDKEMD